VLSDADLRRTLSERGLARAREFSWETSIRRIHEVYMDVAAQRSSAP
jgi:glycosyltransferase involved in cell wall biosynthesis